MKLKKILIPILSLSFLIGGISNANAYYSKNKENNSSIKMENVDIRNLYTNLNNIGKYYPNTDWAYNGTTSVSNNIITMTWNGGANASDNCMYYGPYIHNFSTYINQVAAENLGMEVEGDKVYKISYEITGDKYNSHNLVLNSCDENYNCNTEWLYWKLQNSTATKVGLIFKTPKTAKYISIRHDIYFNNPVSGDSVQIKNLKIQKILN